jgi:hypothetical protein
MDGSVRKEQRNSARMQQASGLHTQPRLHHDVHNGAGEVSNFLQMSK